MMPSEEMSGEARMSGFGDSEKPFNSQGFLSESLGQSYPHQNPQGDETLGEPLSIREVADVIGCSDWTVRHRYLPQGLPHFRSGPAGKFVFFRKQVIAWILQQQKKGGR
jgi:hypothetical protein